MTNYCVFILTFGRPENQKTLKTLRRQGYTGKIYFVVSDDDITVNEYISLYGVDSVKVFSKKDYDYLDSFDNFENRKVIMYARNAVYDIANDLGYKYFFQFDDDYIEFQKVFNDKNIFENRRYQVYDLNKLFGNLIGFYSQNNIVKSICIAQGGDFIGGKDSNFVKNGITTKRKGMNTFLCSTDRRIFFLGRLNEDVNTYVKIGSTGEGIILTTNQIQIVQTQTQSSNGGMTDIYLDGGTYIKSMYSLIQNPSSVKIALMGGNHYRIHHKVLSNNTYVKIIREEFKK